MGKITVHQGGAAGGGAVYGLGFIGALVYFFQNADTAWLFITAFFKAMFWPALFVYHILSKLQL